MRAIALLLLASAASADDHVSLSFDVGASTDRGLVAGVGYGHHFVLGARTTYGQDGLGLFATAAVQRALSKRIDIGLRFGFGGTVSQGNEDPMLSLRGPAEQPVLSNLSFIAETTLEGVIAVKLDDRWSLTLAGGPSTKLESGIHAWAGAIGIAVKTF